MASSRSFRIAYVSSFIFWLCCGHVNALRVTVDAPCGKMQGEAFLDPGEATNETSLVYFSNIPYARPPIGNLRFAKPETLPRMDGVFDATDDTPIACIQPMALLSGYETPTEDCLILNIFTKSVQPSKMKKVLVFIHPGHFVTGTSHFHNMTSLVTTHDVIGVTINYRLGVLGFLSTGNDASPGNYGLWDQNLALTWVKNNIAAFGGDPDDVTVVGVSTGGASASFQSISPMGKGLFTKVVHQSGTATGTFALSVHVQNHALLFAKHVNCWDKDVTARLDLNQSHTVLSCLRNANASDVSSYFHVPMSEPTYVPTVDADFLPRYPLSLIKNESYLESVGFYDRSYLHTVANHDFSVVELVNELIKRIILGRADLTEEMKKYAILKRANDTMEFYIRSRFNADEFPSTVGDTIMDFYNRRFVNDSVLTNLVSDLTFLIPAYDFLNAASQRRYCKSWFLYFNHYPAFMKGNSRGVIHGADMMYWLDFSVSEMSKKLGADMKGEMDEGDLKVKSMYSALLADFVKHGDPSTSLKDVLSCKWPVYDPENAEYLNFNPQPTVRRHLEREKRDLWLKTVPTSAKNSQERTEL